MEEPSDFTSLHVRRSVRFNLPAHLSPPSQSPPDSRLGSDQSEPNPLAAPIVGDPRLHVVLIVLPGDGVAAAAYVGS
ncbi:MAG: hypothetical protein ACREAC_15815, partial [Blastocatellia bacterium]